jgi:ABC-type molybdenum transport system ATPase subunit/photorepair protein PhrA
LPSIEKLDPKQRSTVDFVVAQDENFYLEGEAGTGKTIVLAHIAMKYRLPYSDAQGMKKQIRVSKRTRRLW